MPGKFCVSCGRTDVDLVEGILCPDCYVKHRLTVEAPKEIHGKLCRLCGSMWLSGKWVRPMTENPMVEYIWKLVVPKLKVDKHVTEYEVGVERIWKDVGGRTFTTIVIKGKIGRTPVEVRKDVLLNVQMTLCDVCMRRKGGGYEAKVQLRFKSGGLDFEKRSLFESFMTSDLAKYLTDVVEGREGVDYYFANKAAAKRLVSSFIAAYREAEVKETFENEKIDRDGKRSAKLVISLRL